MISAGFDDCKREHLYKTEEILCKNNKCQKCPVEELCLQQNNDEEEKDK